MMRMLDFDFFEILDSVTIARSRKHIEKYYNMNEIGHFPMRLPPISKRPPLTDLSDAITYGEIYDLIISLTLSIYTPSNYILPSRMAKYADLNHEGKNSLTQAGREQGIRRLMSINLLKRLESSVHSFRLTLQRIQKLIADTLETINAFDPNQTMELQDLTAGSTDLDADDAENDLLAVGKKVHIALADMDYLTWQQDLQADLQILNLLVGMVADITPQHDSKLQMLLATIAGFGGIIGIFVRFIRGYNRISPYIVFFALLAVGLALEKQLTQRTGRNRKALAAVAILLLGYGYWEQQGFFRPEYEEIQDKWYQDEAFMNEVEAAAGDGAMLFTLPYMKNFENGSLNNMWDYTLLRGPLHSKTLKFTYGAGYGTKNDLWYRETSELEPDAMVAELRTQGMTGIYLDLDGYPEDEQQSTLAALTEAAGCGPEDVIHSGSGLLCYIPLGQE